MDNKVLIGLIIGGLVIVSLILTFLILPFMQSGFAMPGTAKVAHLHLDGAIMMQDSGSLFVAGGVTSEDFIKKLKHAKKDTGIKAVVIEINSPGGAVVPSKEIAEAVEQMGKPTVAWIHEIGASGGYWVASSADYIIADELAITGSIGVIASQLGFEGLIKRYNISYRQLTGGEYKDAGIPYRAMTDKEQSLFQERIDIIHDVFKEAVRKNRKLTTKEIDNIATGMFYLGSQAKELKLVDALGDKRTVEKYLKETLEVEEITFVEYKDEPSFFDILAQAMQGFSFYLGKGIADGFSAEMKIET